MNASAQRPSLGNILVVDDTPANLQLLATVLNERGYKVRPAPSGKLALQAALREPPDLVLLDINMPEMDGFEVCRRLKADLRLAAIPVIFISATRETSDKVQAFAVGGVDYVTKPFQFEEVQARVATHLELRRVQTELLRNNQRLEGLVASQVKEISDAQVATIVALAKLAESRDEDTGSHVVRTQEYSRALAVRLAEKGEFHGAIDARYIENLFYASALHDIGKVGIPDSILLKQGSLTCEEFDVMKTHTLLGAKTLAAVLERYPSHGFGRMGMDLARSHHERWNGTGYPDGLAGEAIPLVARIFTIADQYDALRNKRPYKPAFDEAKSREIILRGDGRTVPAHFDARVLSAFEEIAPEFDAIFKAHSD